MNTADANVVTYGILSGINPKSGHTDAVEHALLATHDHMSCWRKSEVPARLHYGTNPRIPALLCRRRLADHFARHGEEAQEILARRARLRQRRSDDTRVVRRPAFNPGLLVPEFDNVDVYALLARLLAIRPQPNDGDEAVGSAMLRDPR